MAKYVQNIEDFKLNEWIGNVRDAYRNERLSEEQISLMESIPNWRWNPRDAKWQEGFEYAKKYGTVLAKFKTPEGFRLGEWERNQRAFKKRGKLSEERIKLLESIPGWVWNIKEAAWMEGYLYSKKYGRVTVGTKTPDGFKLGVWQNSQRMFYRKGSLTKKRIAHLESVSGWIWT